MASELHISARKIKYSKDRIRAIFRAVKSCFVVAKKEKNMLN
jgi:hypothetical protein